jgi:hypothetical protein
LCYTIEVLFEDQEDGKEGSEEIRPSSHVRRREGRNGMSEGRKRGRVEERKRGREERMKERVDGSEVFEWRSGEWETVIGISDFGFRFSLLELRTGWVCGCVGV